MRHITDIDPFFLIRCRFTGAFLAAVGLTTAALYDKIELQCQYCGHYHTFSLKKDGTFKVVTT